MNRLPFPRPRAGLVLAVLAVLLASLAMNAAAAPDRTKPTTPSNLRVTATTPTSVALAWNPSTDNSGSFLYVVREVSSGQTRSVAQTQTTFTWTGLTPNRTYRFNIYAVDGSNNKSSNSNTVTANTPAAPPLTAPANLRVTGATLSSLSIAWDPVAGATNYHVFSGASAWTASPQPSATLTGLQAGTTYSITVRAFGASGSSPLSAPLSASTPADTTAPSAPALSATALSPGVLRLSWTPSTENSSYVSYNVYLDGVPARNMLPEDVPGATRVDIHNLRGGRTYELSVRAYDGSGNFSEPGVLTFTMPSGTDTQAPAAPGNLRTSQVLQPGSVALAWNWANDNVGTIAYGIYMDGELVGETTWDVHYPGVDTFFTVRRLTPGTTHTFTVKARDEAGNLSAASNELTVTLPPSTDTEAPGAPTNLTGSTWPNCAFIDFNWGAPADNVDHWSQLEYAIYEDGLLRGYYRGEVFETSFGRHTYVVRALDRAGNLSAPSNAIVLDSGLSC
jgi:chitodextrinase